MKGTTDRTVTGVDISSGAEAIAPPSEKAWQAQAQRGEWAAS
jgi:hypothetical protein